MLNWIKSHPVWAGLGFVLFVILLWMIFGGSSGNAPAGGAVITYQPQSDPSSVAAGMQTQIAQYQYQADLQKTNASLEAAMDANATQISLAQIEGQKAIEGLTLQAQLAKAKIDSDAALATLTTTLSAQTAQAQITAQQQAAQLQASIAMAQVSSQDRAAQLAAQTEQSRIESERRQAEQQAQFNAQMFAQSQQTQQQLIEANAAVAKAQIKANKSKCYITTAACEVLGKADDCRELTTLRTFRDGWLKARVNGTALIAVYYKCAPRVVGVMKELPDADVHFLALWDDFIVPAVAAIDEGDNELAFARYIDMLKEVSRYDAGLAGYLSVVDLGWDHMEAEAARLAA